MPTDHPTTTPQYPDDGRAEEGGPFAREMAFLRQRLAVLRPAEPVGGPAAFSSIGDDPRARMSQAASERAAILSEHGPGGLSAFGLAPAEQPHLLALATPRQLPEDFRLRRMREYRARRRHASSPTPAAPDGPQSFEPPLPPPANNWIPIGPSVMRQGQGADRPAVSGRIAGIAVAPGGQRVYAGSANGGVWRSDDGGLTWTSCMDSVDLHPTTRQSDSLSVGAIALDPADPDRVYVGTGEGNTVFIVNGQIWGSSAFFGVGPLRSDDGGQNWIPESTAPGSPSLQGTAFFQLALDPADPDRVIAATLVGLFRREPDGSGGSHWVQKLTGIFTTVRAARSGNVTTFYAARWGGGIFRSTDGDSWTSIPGFPTQNVGRVGLGVATNNPNIVYALAARVDNDHVLGVWRLDGGTGPWRPVAGVPTTLFGPAPTDPNKPGQGGYDLAIAVDPTNGNRLFLGGSTAEAQGQWSGSAYRCVVIQSGPASNPAYSMTAQYVGDLVHADIHTLEFTPDSADRLWLGCDGGVFATGEATGACRFSPRNTGLATLTMNHLAMHPTEDAVLFCGTQDNGHGRYTGDECWLHAVWGDGGYGVIHPRQTRRILTTYVYGSINRAEDGGQGYNSWNSVDVPLFAGTPTSAAERVEFYAPLVGLNNPTTDAEADLVAFGSIRPWLSDQFGDNWVSIPSNDLAADSLNGTIRSLRFASANKLYAGTSTGGVYRFDQSGTTWTRTVLNPDTSGPGALPFNVPITCIAVDTADTTGNSIYITLAGTGNFRHVWHFDGAAWQERSGPAGQPAAQLLDVQHNAIVADPANPGTLYAGADIGIWRSQNGGETWERFSFGLPEAAVLDLALHPRRRLLWAATHGRGVYEYALDSDTARGVELFLRHTPLDRGRRPTDVGLPDPTSPDGEVDPMHSPDIKLDVPDAQGQYQTPTSAITFYQFSDSIHDPGTAYMRLDAAENPLVYRAYIQVHQRGVQLVSTVRVMLLVAPVGNALPNLPTNYHLSLQQGNPISTTPWQTIGRVVLPNLQVGFPRIAAVEFPTTVFPSNPSQSGYALVALVHCAEDSYTNTDTDLGQLSVTERRMALKVIQVQ
jgi:hypothetical protein